MVPRGERSGPARDRLAVTLTGLKIGDESLHQQPAVYVSGDATGSDGLLPLKWFAKVLFDAGNRQVLLWR
jgi:hypothetical protein